MGILFVTLGVLIVLISFVTGEFKSISLSSLGIGHIGAGIFMLIVHYFENKKQYLTLENGVLIKNTLPPKKIRLTEIKSIREFAGDLKLAPENNKFVINAQIIEPISLAKLKNEL